MTPRRFFFAVLGMTTLLALLVLIVAFLGDGLLKKQAQKLSDLKAQNQVVQDQEVALVQAKKDIEKYKSVNELTDSIVPQDKDQARTVRELTSIAAQSGIDLAAITFSASTLGQAPAAAPKASEDSGEKKTDKPAAALPTITQVTPVDGISGVYALAITITPNANRPVTYQQFLDFLGRLENNRRTAHVDSITVSPVAGSNRVSFSLTLNAYVKP